MRRVVIYCLVSALLVLSGCASSVWIPATPGTVTKAFNEDGVPLEIRIDQIKADDKDPSGKLRLYYVSFRDSPSSPWAPLCEPDGDNQTGAIPVEGHWNDAGNYVESSAITFACTNGVLAKCMRWGYRPWASLHQHSLKRLHQACVRMTRADYCGNGHSHTHDDTLIDLFDDVGVQEREKKNGLEFEAAWSPDGAVYINHPRWGSLDEIVASCPEKLRGHTSLDTPNLTLAEIRSRWPEALIFNDSVPGGCLTHTPALGAAGCIK